MIIAMIMMRVLRRRIGFGSEPAFHIRDLGLWIVEATGQSRAAVASPAAASSYRRGRVERAKPLAKPRQFLLVRR